jgi:hypothetical protein
VKVSVGLQNGTNWAQAQARPIQSVSCQRRWLAMFTGRLNA